MYSPQELDPSGQVLGSFSFSSTMNSAALSRTTFSLKLRDLVGHNKELLSIRSFIGGISGILVIIGKVVHFKKKFKNFHNFLYFLILIIRVIKVNWEWLVNQTLIIRI